MNALTNNWENPYYKQKYQEKNSKDWKLKKHSEEIKRNQLSLKLIHQTKVIGNLQFLPQQPKNDKKSSSTMKISKSKCSKILKKNL